MANRKDQDNPAPVPQHGTYPVHPLTALRQQMDRLFDDFLSGRGTMRPGSLFDTQLGGAFGTLTAAPQIDIVEDDKELVITAELPGIDEKDVEVVLDQGVLTIRGEKKSESERKEERLTVSERRYGSFRRSLSLPEGIDEDQVSARFDKGVLTIRIGRRPDATRKARHIPIGR